MSGHETIRVLEVGVGSSTASSVSDDKLDSGAEGRDDHASKQPDASQDTAPQIAGGAGNYIIYITWFWLLLVCGSSHSSHMATID